MSIASEITRIQGAKADLKTAINAKTDAQHKITTETIDDYADFVDSISGGGSATLITKSITQNGTYNASSDNADGYSQVTVNVSGGGTVEPEEKDVNFYDYDGTRLYSYTKTEFLALQSMPENPTHTGLTAQGWNWTLSDAQTAVTKLDELQIGQSYITSDGSTRVYIETNDSNFSIKLSVGVYANTTNTIDWGDNTETYSFQSSSKQTMTADHTYSTKGEYIIKIQTTGDYIYLVGNQNGGENLITGVEGTTSNGTKNKKYSNMVKKIELGNTNYNDSSAYSFYHFSYMKSVTLPLPPNNTGNDFSISFNNCNSLKCLCLPKNLTRITAQSFASTCRTMEIISLPKIVYFNYTAFSGCWNLKKMPYFGYGTVTSNCFDYTYKIDKIKFEENITAISGAAFVGSGAKVYDFTNNTSIPTLTSGAFNDCYTNFEVWVPASLYDTWKTRTNWSSISSHIVSK